MLNDYLELLQVKFLIEHWLGVVVTFIIFAILLYFSMSKKNEVNISNHSLVKGDNLVNVTKVYHDEITNS